MYQFAGKIMDSEGKVVSALMSSEDNAKQTWFAVHTSNHIEGKIEVGTFATLAAQVHF